MLRKFHNLRLNLLPTPDKKYCSTFVLSLGTMCPHRGKELFLMTFVHLHVPSEYSFWTGLQAEGACQPCQELGNACACSDRPWRAARSCRFLSISLRSRIKPILGCEVYKLPAAGWKKAKTTGKTTI
jgi:hypothetical protein